MKELHVTHDYGCGRFIGKVFKIILVIILLMIAFTFAME